ncbi:unnamed protein product [Caenorhabditis angaria]|uniref:Secreted protein n=1 Tax=Caenorhabditis angaria TaxID=860376 RepID=A0A9P1IMI1_9PELO|nr:unnamed protein product [Caenorhabditis angaria]
MKLYLIFLLIFLISSISAYGTTKSKLSKNTKKHVNRLVNCLTPVDTVLAAKTADCTDSFCVSSAKQYAQKKYPQQYHSTVVPCLSSTTITTPIPTKSLDENVQNSTVSIN